MLRLTNTLSRKKEPFRPLKKGRVGLYTCGPTVYNYAHIGNLRTYIFEDVLRRALEFFGYRVTHVMNITDVGHLTSDSDAGEDKLEKGAAREGKTVWDIARFYTKAFLADITRLNIKRAHKLIPATKRIPEQIAIIQRLLARGLAYETTQAVYFDISKFPGYTKLTHQSLAEKITRARDEVVEDPEKRHPTDFALWFKRVGRFQKHIMHWPSPWGDGFPGWHIECSAISTSELGQPFDIHTGGVDHIAVHHTNELAQSEGAFGKPLARYWIHGEFLLVDREKMAKSRGSFFTLQDLTKKGFDPLAFRYLILTSHYRSKLNFTWDSLRGAQNSLERLREFARELRRTKRAAKRARSLARYRAEFRKAIENDLDTPHALAVVWTVTRTYRKSADAFEAKDVRALLSEFDSVLGLDLMAARNETIPLRIRSLVAKREGFRKKRDWNQADAVRREIEAAGFSILDTSEGPRIVKKN